MKNIKTFVILPLRNDALKGDVEITEYNPITGKLPQQHIGYLQNCHNDAVRAVAKRIEEYNDIVRDYNHMVESREFLSDHTHTLYEQL